MFDAHHRLALSEEILARAEQDTSIPACAVLGSVARGQQDSWSDIDVALEVAQASDLDAVVRHWTLWLKGAVEVADTMDVRTATALYRVFLLASSLQVDLSFWPHGSLRSTGEPIEVVFGEVADADPPSGADVAWFAKMGWLCALHARSATARGRGLQADLMISGLREQVVSMACARLGLDFRQGRDAHRLPVELTMRLLASRAASVDADELHRSLESTLAVYQDEVSRHDQALAASLAGALASLVAK